MELTLDTNRGMGFGDMLCLISLLCDLGEPVTLYSNNRETYYDRIKRLTELLSVPEDRLKILPTEKEGDFAGAYHLKTVGNYYYPEKITVDGTEIDLNKPRYNKPYIGMCMYNGDGYIDSGFNFWRNNEQHFPVAEGSDRTNRIPQCKWRTIDYYSEVFAMIKRCGYEVITFDHHNMMEAKMKFLAENCAAVIGYEGGMAHLCHMFKIPYLMFKYRSSPDVDDLYGPFTQEVIHQSRTVHFIQDDNAFVKMNKQELEKLLQDLTKGITNNRIVNNQVKMVFDNGIASKIKFLDQRNGEVLHSSKFGPQVSKKAEEVINAIYKHQLSRDNI